MQPIKFFCSYSHQDEAYRADLEKHLAGLKRQQAIHSWHDRQITAGEQWAEQIAQKLEEADVVLLLISPDFMASDYCYDKEMTRALERHAQGLAKVVPILLRPTDLHGSPFLQLQGLPFEFKPISKWPVGMKRIWMWSKACVS